MANVLCNVLLDTAFVGGRKNSCVALTPKYEDECIYEFLIEYLSILYLV